METNEKAREMESDWKEFETNRNVPMFQDFEIKFDTGDVVRFTDSPWPFGVVTHWRPLPKLK